MSNQHSADTVRSLQIGMHIGWDIHFKGPERGLFINLQASSFIFNTDQELFKALPCYREGTKKRIPLLLGRESPAGFNNILLLNSAGPVLLP